MSARMRSLKMLVRALRRPTPRSRKPPRRPEAGGVPVAPDRPSTLDGGAAAALSFDEA